MPTSLFEILGGPPLKIDAKKFVQSHAISYLLVPAYIWVQRCWHSCGIKITTIRVRDTTFAPNCKFQSKPLPTTNLSLRTKRDQIALDSVLYSVRMSGVEEKQVVKIIGIFSGVRRICTWVQYHNLTQYQFQPFLRAWTKSSF